MELRSLDYFLAVAMRGSLRAAAQSVGITQPALTKAIRRLEDGFGAQLFDRNARGVTLTSYGHVVLRHARDLQISVKAVNEEVAALRQGVTGLVRIGAGPSWQDAVLADAIGALRAERPGIHVRVTGGTDDELKKQLKAGDLDFIVAAVPETQRLEPALAWRSLLRDEYCVIADENHPLRSRAGIAPDALLAYPWILPSASTYMLDRLRLMLRGHGLPLPQTAIETDVNPLKFALMRASTYLSFHAEAHRVATAPSYIQPLAIAGTTATRDAGIIVIRDAVQNPAVRFAIDTLIRSCERMAASVSKLGRNLPQLDGLEHARRGASGQ